MLKNVVLFAALTLFESQTKEGGWRFSVGGWGRPEGGSFSEVTFRAKAIVWK